jgi:hypothetical protein
MVPGTDKMARTLAQGRLQHELARLRDAGAEADGEVVDPLRVDAIHKLASRGGRRDHRVRAAASPVPLDGRGSAAPRPERRQAAGDSHQRTGRPLALTARGRRGALATVKR